MRYKRVIDDLLMFPMNIRDRIGASVPGSGVELVDRAGHADVQLRHRRRSLRPLGGIILQADHGRKPSKIIWSAKRAAIFRSVSVRTAHVNSGKPKTCRATAGASAGKSTTA